MLSGHCLPCHSNLQLINSSHWCCHISESQWRCECLARAIGFRGLDNSNNKQEVSRKVSSDNKKKDVKLNEELPKSLIAIKHLRNVLELYRWTDCHQTVKCYTTGSCWVLWLTYWSSAIHCPSSWCDEWKIAGSEGGNVHYPLPRSRIGT